MSVIDDIKREVREATTVGASAVALIQAFIVRLRNAISNNNTAELEDLVRQLDVSTNALANAVTYGTDIEGTEDELDEDEDIGDETDAPGEVPAEEYENPADNPNNNTNNPDTIDPAVDPSLKPEED